MNISYDAYRAFCCVARTGSITAAAREMLSTQPNLTRTIHQLEDAVHCRLFERSNRGVSLTKEGERLYAHVSVAFEHIAAGEAEIEKSVRLEAGLVSIAASEVALRCFLLPILSAFREMHPKVRVRVGNYSTPEAIRALRDGFAELAAVTTPIDEDDSLDRKTLARFSEVPVCGLRCPELISGRHSLSELAKYPIVGLGRQTKTCEFYARVFAAHGLSYSPEIEAATADQIMPLVEAGLGIGFVPESFLAENRSVRRIALEESIPERKICLLTRKESALSLPAAELQRLCLPER
ncbi:MAG: LysR family transcriptional regulator [Eubacteriales bacterium]|nr:LysR family transcriptional regulator [Eubacteriales bacterium]MDD3881128.1 LysR family transcriptional regulator [Eubacteriales bacterium]MDD4511510.1 LysR family transcriptional regulator [Eubacteriales bacterium]